MCSSPRRVLGLSAWLMVAATTTVAASAYPLRSPQVVFDASPLQSLFASLGDAIDPGTRQLAVQTWMPDSVLGAASEKIRIDLLAVQGSGPSLASIGIYSAVGGSAPLREVLPRGMWAGVSAVCTITASHQASVVLSDEAGQLLGSVVYPDIDRNHFGFYIDGPGGTWFSEDARNEGHAQMLVFDGSGGECERLPKYVGMEGDPYDAGSSTFSGVVIRVSVLPTDCEWPTAVRRSTWGGLKSVYR